jgi:hypothetical protein
MVTDSAGASGVVMDFYDLMGISSKTSKASSATLPLPPDLPPPDLPSSPVTDAALALMDLSTTVSQLSTAVSHPSTSHTIATTVSPSCARYVPPPVSYQDIVSSLNRPAMETRARPARRRGGRGRPPIPRLSKNAVIF